jgi:hypothetical protein
MSRDFVIDKDTAIIDCESMRITLGIRNWRKYLCCDVEPLGDSMCPRWPGMLNASCELGTLGLLTGRC